MGNLSSCLRAAGEYLGADHREFILDQARGKRGDARNAAAIEAVDTLLARIEDQIAAAGGAVGLTAADETAPEERASTRREDLFPEEFADETTTVRTDRVVSSSGETAEGGNVNSRGALIATTKQGLQNFWRWFRDSQATDRDDKPLVLYHSTNADTDVLQPGQPSENSYGLLGSQPVTRAGIFMTPSPNFSQEYLREAPGQNVMPVYARLENPLDLRSGLSETDEQTLERAGLSTRYVINRQNYWELFDNADDGSNEFVAGLKQAGYDGAIFNEASPGGDSEGGVTYMVFDAEQAKSAVGNRGTFDPSSPDVRASPTRWDAPEVSKMDNAIRYLQDKQVDLKRVVKAVTDQIGDLGDKWDAYLQEELYHERAAKKTKDFLDFELRPLLRAMQAAGVDLEGFETYLHNRHAEERNVQVAKINDQMPDGGSGIMTEDARAYLAGLDPALRAKYEALAAKVDAINGATEALLVSSGLEKQETIDAWKGAYSKYVPLQREEFEEDSARGTGPGFSISGSASKRAMGSDKPVANILANIAMQRERTITRAEKNRVATALFGMAIQAPKKDFWKAFSPDRMRKDAQIVDELVQLGMAPPDAAAVAAEPTQRYVDPRSGRVVTRVNPLLRSDPNIVALRVNGEDRFVMFNHRDERANQVARAVKNLDADQLGRVMGVMATISRYFASINTQWNPLFGVVNLTRDVQGAIVNLSSTPLADHKLEVLRQTGSALAGIWADIRAHRKGRVPQSPWAQLWEEFQNEGGPTGYRHLYENPKERSEKIAAELKSLSQSGLRNAVRADGPIFGWLSDYNETLENAVRLSAYKVAKEQGLSNQRAASLAKNLTVNFNRKGQVATQAGALYAFFNASVQGTTRLAQTLAGPAGKKIVMGALLLGVLQAFTLRSAGFDEEEPPEFVRDRNLVLPLGLLGVDGKKYLTVPMPLGLHVLPGISRRTTEWLLAGGRDPGTRLVGMLGLIADAFNPIGNAGISLQTVAPTPVDWLAALAENKDFSGRPIAKEDRSGLDPTPGYTRTRDTATGYSKVASYWLNLFSGGTDYKPGAFSPTPDQIDYFIGQLTGGLGRTISGATTSVTATTTGEELPPYRIPLLGKFYGNAEGQAAEASKFYSNLKRINGHQAELKGLRKEGKGAEAQAYLRANPEARLALLADRLERDLSEAKRQKRMLVEKGASRDAVKLVETRITKIMTTLNRRVDALSEASGGSDE